MPIFKWYHEYTGSFAPCTTGRGLEGGDFYKELLQVLDDAAVAVQAGLEDVCGILAVAVARERVVA